MIAITLICLVIIVVLLIYWIMLNRSDVKEGSVRIFKIELKFKKKTDDNPTETTADKPTKKTT